MHSSTRLAVALAALVALSACASFSPDGGFDAVSEMTRARTGQTPTLQRTDGDAATARERVAELLAQPLSADGAVEIALLNNRGLQASFAALGVAEADLVQAGRLRNPSFSFSRLAGGGLVEINRSIVVDVLTLLRLPAARQAQQQRFEQAQMQAAFEAVAIAAQARRAFYNAVAAQELVRYHAQVKEAAEASNELAQRMQQAGNFNRLAQLREQAFHADAVAQLARAQHQASAERERLIRVLGLSGEQLGFRLPERLPELPQQPVQPKDAEQTALDTRLDVLMAKRATETTARSLGLTRATRMIDGLSAGIADKHETGQARQDGYEVELELPLFDYGSARVARAEAIYMQSVHRAAEVAVNARSEVREAHSAYSTAYALARHYRDDVVPLRKRISEENLLRYNGMLIGVFELLADSRDQIASVTGYVEALRDHWLAETDLRSALTGGTPPSGAAADTSTTRNAAARGAAH